MFKHIITILITIVLSVSITLVVTNNEVNADVPSDNVQITYDSEMDVYVYHGYFPIELATIVTEEGEELRIIMIKLNDNEGYYSIVRME